MTNDECQLYMDAELPCYTRVSGAKVKVKITGKKEDVGFGNKRKQTEWNVKRVDNGKVLTPRNARALHKTPNFLSD